MPQGREMRETRRPLPSNVRGSVRVHTVPHSHAGAHARVNININLPRAESRDVNQGNLQLQGGRREEGSRTAQDAGQRRGRLSRGPSEKQGGLSCDRSSSAWLDELPASSQSTDGAGNLRDLSQLSSPAGTQFPPLTWEAHSGSDPFHSRPPGHLYLPHIQ